MSKVFYIGMYDETGSRFVSPAAVTMMDYIIESVRTCGKDITVISAAQSDKNKINRSESFIGKRKVIYIKANKIFSTKNVFGRLSNRINRLKLKFALERELEKQIKDGDTVIVYHTLEFINCIRRLKKKKKINLILQVNEVYADVIKDASIKKKELSYFQIADSYIFSTEFLEKVNISRKKQAICSGTYTSNCFVSNKRTNGETIHCVYAGTLAAEKGGTIAVETAKFLPSNYHMHILGFGSKTEIDNIKRQIDIVSSKTSAKITYDGVLRGNNYLKFLSNCDIGLCTQAPNADFNATSFPSKILSYMASGLRVVSICIPAIEQSAVGEYMYYYTEPHPESIAEAIKNVNLLDGYNGRQIIEKLNENFLAQLEELFN